MQNADLNTDKAFDGYRAKILESYSKINLNDLSPYQVLEYILFYVFPRGDVNPLARRLLDRFGTVQNVLEANEHSLKQVYGINDRAAKMIAGFSRIFDFYENSKMERKAKIEDWAEVYDTCESLVRFQSKEYLYIIGLDSKFRILNFRKLGTGSSASVASGANAVFDFINETNATNIIFTHNHPNGVCTPSTTDKINNEKLKEYVRIIGAQFIDHIVIGSDGVYSLRNNKKVRSFLDTDDVRYLAKNYKNKV